jgi:uncharacterized protein (DUF427 family)
MRLIDETTSSDMDLPAKGAVLLDIVAEPRRVRAMFAGHVIADSVDVLILRRQGRPDMRFFPRDDVETGYLGETPQALSDPDLGGGHGYTWTMEGEIVEQAACSFDDPPMGAESLAGRLCLSPTVFEIYTLTAHDLEVAPRATHPHGSTA